MDYLPIFTDLRSKPVLVIGGGGVALRKVRLLQQAGADVTVIAPAIDDGFNALPRYDDIMLIGEVFSAAMHQHLIRRSVLVIAATNDDDVNHQVYQLCERLNVLANVVDDPANSRFIFPSIIDRSPIMVAVSSGGSAPVLVRRLRERLEATLPRYLGPLASLIGRYRPVVKKTFSQLSQRRGFWERLLSSPVVSLLQQEKSEEAEALLNQQLESPLSEKGEVYIVGGGPGDPDLLTLKALQLMQQADVVVHDGLVSPEVLDLARRDAEFISVQKQAGNHSVPQDEINQILVDKALAGHKVCRLKGGDPFIFGRGGEEAETLIEHDIAFQIVPGVTAAAGCSAYAGIPLTHRDYAQTVQFVTGHSKKNGRSPDWASLAKENQTLMVYMGLINSAEISAKLIEAGRSSSTPVAIVERGTTKQQRVVTGTLATLNQIIAEQAVQSPGMIIIGEVVALHKKLAWFGDTPQDSALAQPLIHLAS